MGQGVTPMKGIGEVTSAGVWGISPSCPERPVAVIPATRARITHRLGTMNPSLRDRPVSGLALNAQKRPAGDQLMVMAFSFVLLASFVSPTALPSSETTNRL